MKKLICEFCESTDIKMVTGVYTCQMCGTIYSTEEIKRMMPDEGKQDTDVYSTDDAFGMDFFEEVEESNESSMRLNSAHEYKTPFDPFQADIVRIS